MTDEELVKRLRKRREAEFIDGYERVEWEDEDALEAADRIEALKAKLATAIEIALEDCPVSRRDRGVIGWWHDRRATLAEIEGEKP
jgi:hypothetical protein